MMASETAVSVTRPAQRTHVRRAAFWMTAAAVIALDQGTKAIVRASLDRGEAWPEDSFVRLHHVTNSGAAFGILQGQVGFLIVMALIGLAAIYMYYRNPPFDHWISGVAIGMMLGGAAGNLIDRLRLERVTDFIDVGSWPTFNLADASIDIGVGVLIIGYLLFAEKKLTHHSEGQTPEEPATAGAPHEDPAPHG